MSTTRASPRASLAPYPVYPLWEVLGRTAERLPDKVAVIDGERKATFAQLEAQTSRVALALAAMGVGKGENVALFAPNCLEFITAFYGIVKTGATITTLNAGYRAREVAHQLKDSGARILIAHGALLSTAQEAMQEVQGIEKLIVIGSAPSGVAPFAELLQHRGKPPRVRIDPQEDVAALPYSSGTTGLSKGVMLTHYNLTCNLHQFLDRQHEEGVIREDDVLLVHLPLFHSYGLTALMNGGLKAGATQVLMNRFDIEQCLELMSQHRITMLFTVPPVILLLAQFPDLKNYDLSAMRLCLSGAAPLGAELQQRFEALAGIITIQGYGLTETSPVTNADYAEPELRKVGSIGPPLPDTEEKIVDLEKGERELSPGEIGELVIKGPQVMKEYWKKPEATADMIRNGWLYTGDIARMDESGYVYILDRKKELIKYKGFQVPPAELEALVLEHPAVADAAVVGKPDLEAGEIPKAYIVLKDRKATAEEIMTFVEQKVAGFKKLREVEFVDQVPKSPSGKLLRRILVEQERQRKGL